MKLHRHSNRNSLRVIGISSSDCTWKRSQIWEIYLLSRYLWSDQTVTSVIFRKSWLILYNLRKSLKWTRKIIFWNWLSPSVDVQRIYTVIFICRWLKCYNISRAFNEKAYAWTGHPGKNTIEGWTELNGQCVVAVIGQDSGSTSTSIN